MEQALNSKASESKQKKAYITVAVAGNPNSGKSTLINSIAGSRLHVGNWPGVTVEKKEAEIEVENKKIKLIDLPGTYSLSPYTQEEIIARDFLVKEKPDLILNVVDSTNLERNLYLTIQLMELGIPIIIALNIFDEAEKKGYKIDIKAIEEILDLRVIPTIATQQKGTNALLHEIVKLSDSSSKYQPKTLLYSTDIENARAKLEQALLEKYPHLADQYSLRWLTFKIMENDREAIKKYEIRGFDQSIEEAVLHLKIAHDEDVESVMTDARYGQATGLSKEVLKKPKIKKREITEAIDRFVLNRYLGIPIFFIAMWFMFKLTFDIANPYVDWLDGLFSGGVFARWATDLLSVLSAPHWVISLVTEGIVFGVGFVLTFVPVIFMMMFFITILEASGYMARAAFVMDRAMHAIGLHGKSFIPMLLGFGCNVPAVYATRTLENERDKILTSLLVPLMSCGARLPIYVLFAGTFFTAYAGTAIWSMYIMGIVIAILVGFVFKKTLFKGEAPVFIMELPPYRLPTLKSIMIHTWEKGKHFLVKAGTYILAVSILVWAMLNIHLPLDSKAKKDSILGHMGQAIAPAFKPLGFGTWETSASLITGVIAKEIFIGTSAQIYAGGQKKAKTTRVSLEKLSTPLNNIKEFKNKIKFGLFNEKNKKTGIETRKKGLTFFGVMTEKEKQGLLTLSSEKDYRLAIEKLFEKSQDPSFFEDIKELGLSLGSATLKAVSNVFGGIGLASMSTEEDEDMKRAKQGIKKDFTPLSAYALMAFALLYMPCVITLVAMKNEFKKWKWIVIPIVYQTALAWIVAFIIFQGGTLLGLGG